MTSCAVTIQKTLFGSRTSPWCYLFLTFTTTSLKLFFNFDIWQSWEWLPSFIWFYTHRVPVKNQYTVSNHRQSLALSDQSNENIKDVFFFFISRLLSLPYLPLLWHSWHRLLKESASCQTHLSEVQNPEWTLDHWTNYWSSSTNCNVRYWRLGYCLFLQVLKPLIWPRKEIFVTDILSKLMKWKRLERWVGARLNAWNIGSEIVVQEREKR